MQVELKSKADMVNGLANLRSDWAKMLDGLTPEQMEQPNTFGDWSFHDVVSHLTGWRQLTLARFEAAASGGSQAPETPWPDNLTDVERINVWIRQNAGKTPLGELLALSDEVLRRLDVALIAIPEEHLLEEWYFDWMEGYSLVDVLQGSLEHYYEEHGPEIDAWLLTQKRAKQA